MKNVLIDCGTHYGEGLAELSRRYKVDSTWRVLCFEANPHIQVEDKLKIFDFPIHLYKGAIWNKNETLTFYPQHSSDGINHDIQGFGSALAKVNSTEPGLAHSTSTIVKAYDIAEILRKNAGNHTVIKLDIEGAEKEVIERMIDTETIYLVDKLYVEWHSWIGENVIKELRTALRNLGINFEEWT